MAALTVADFRGWRKIFYGFGRIIRDSSGQISKIVELKDATRKQRQIKEVNPSYFCFQAKWLWENIGKLSNHNAQKEYYLTDLAGLAINQGHKIATFPISAYEALGINTPGELKLASKIPFD